MVIPLRCAVMSVMLLPATSVEANTIEPDEKQAAWFEGGFDLAEIRVGKNKDRFAWESAFSYGNQRDQAVLKFDGGGEVGRHIDEIETRLLYSRDIGEGFALQGGVRHDFRPHPYNTFAVLGAEGDVAAGTTVEAMFFLSEKGDLTGEFKLVVERPVSPALVADARAELNWAGQAMPAEDLGSGPTDTEFSLRLRYIGNETIVPYLGVVHGRLLADTADLARVAGERRKSIHFVVGLSLGFGPRAD